jgi:hypothetical protein
LHFTSPIAKYAQYTKQCLDTNFKVWLTYFQDFTNLQSAKYEGEQSMFIFKVFSKQISSVSLNGDHAEEDVEKKKWSYL